MDEGFIIETDGEQSVQPVENMKKISFQGGPGVLGTDPHTLAHRLGAGPDVRDTIHLHEAVGTASGAAEEPARAMVFKAAAEDPHASGVQG